MIIIEVNDISKGPTRVKNINRPWSEDKKRIIMENILSRTNKEGDINGKFK